MAIGALPTSLDRLADAYAALGDDGMQRGLRWYQGQPEAPPRRVFSVTAAREVGLFLSDPMARLPSFARYGSTEYPFAVAVKTGTSQGYRDAWTVAWSRDFLVGAWVGRSDAGTMAGAGRRQQRGGVGAGDPARAAPRGGGRIERYQPRGAGRLYAGAGLRGPAETPEDTLRPDPAGVAAAGQRAGAAGRGRIRE